MIPRGFSVTMVEPRYPVNLGHTARLLKNFGIKRLYLVRPKVDMSVASIYAAHANDVLEDAQVVTFRKLRQMNELLIATTAIKARRKSNIIRRSVRPEQLGRYIQSAKTSSLVLGRDTTGLTNEEIAMCDMTTVVDTGSRYRTLNISHAAAIMLYLVWRNDAKEFRGSSRKAREVFAKNLYDLAVASRMPPHKVRNMLEIGKRIAATSQLADRQLLLISGIFRKAVATTAELQDAASNT